MNTTLKMVKRDMDEVESKYGDLESAIFELRSSIDDFDDDAEELAAWRELGDDPEEVAGELAELEANGNELEQELDDANKRITQLEAAAKLDLNTWLERFSKLENIVSAMKAEIAQAIEIDEKEEAA